MKLIDAVPVIRCKDCIYSGEDESGKLVKDARYCSKDPSFGHLVWSYDFCSEAKKKDS